MAGFGSWIKEGIFGIGEYFYGWFVDLFYNEDARHTRGVRGIGAPWTKGKAVALAPGTLHLFASTELILAALYVKFKLEPWAAEAGSLMDKNAEVFKIVSDQRDLSDKLEEQVRKELEKQLEKKKDEAKDWAKSKKKDFDDWVDDVLIDAGVKEKKKKGKTKEEEKPEAKILKIKALSDAELEQVHTTIGHFDHPRFVPHWNGDEPWRQKMGDITGVVSFIGFGIPIGIITAFTAWRMYKRRKYRKKQGVQDERTRKIANEQIIRVLRQVNPALLGVADGVVGVAGAEIQEISGRLQAIEARMQESNRRFIDFQKAQTRLLKAATNLAAVGALEGHPERERFEAQLAGIMHDYDEALDIFERAELDFENEAQHAQARVVEAIDSAGEELRSRAPGLSRSAQEQDPEGLMAKSQLAEMFKDSVVGRWLKDQFRPRGTLSRRQRETLESRGEGPTSMNGEDEGEPVPARRKRRTPQGGSDPDNMF